MGVKVLNHVDRVDGVSGGAPFRLVTLGWRCDTALTRHFVPIFYQVSREFLKEFRISK